MSKNQDYVYLRDASTQFQGVTSSERKSSNKRYTINNRSASNTVSRSSIRKAGPAEAVLEKSNYYHPLSKVKRSTNTHKQYKPPTLLVPEEGTHFAEAEEIRVMSRSDLWRVVNYATILFLEKGKTSVVLRGLGDSLTKTVDIANVLIRRLMNPIIEVKTSRVSVTGNINSNDAYYRYPLSCISILISVPVAIPKHSYQNVYHPKFYPRKQY